MKQKTNQTQRQTQRRRLRPYIRQFYRGNGWRFALALGETLVMTASTLMISWLIQVIIDLSTGKDVGFTFLQVAAMTAVGVAVEASAFLLAYHSKPAFIARGVEQYQTYVFERLCQKGIGAFAREDTSLYISALSNDATAIENNYLANIFIVVDHSVVCLGALVLMFYYSPLLTLLSVVLAVLPLVVSLRTGNLVAKAEKTVSDRNETYMSTLKDTLVGFSLVKSFRAERQILGIFSQVVQEVSRAKTLRRKMRTLVSGLSGVSGTILQFGVFLTGAFLAISGTGLSAGSVLVFVQLLNFVIAPIGTIPQALAEIRASRALIRKVAEALENNVRQEGGEALGDLRRGIEVRNLSFGYEPEKPVLRDVSFVFEAGKSYAVVGASGSGKSTLLNLLMAACEGYEGHIFYDDKELRRLDSESLYGQVCLVQQNVFVFNASIRDNITMFGDFPRQEVDRAIALSGLSRLIEERGEDYLCGENGSGLSGGEKQRISVARSLLKKSRVLLVDEATAALDAATAFQVASAILDLRGMTRIVVTHGLDESLLRRYDCILTMKNGSITESGSFDRLMEKKGYFYSLFTVSQ